MGISLLVFGYFMMLLADFIIIFILYRKNYSKDLSAVCIYFLFILLKGRVLSAGPDCLWNTIDDINVALASNFTVIIDEHRAKGDATP
ncbi:MAG: hypothetical protein L3J71_04475 [Victivallaceae bacterium]|nr:hypothetical protein [Victivallaceae bacterium]